MAKLVIVTHPTIGASNINKSWIETLKKHPDNFDIHSIYSKYPDLNFDVAAEQALLEKYDEIIFQFPLHWFSTPFGLKKYMDNVLTYGWAFGEGGDKIKGKKIGFAISTGGAEESYQAPKGITVKDLLNDVTLTFMYCGCEISAIHLFHGAMFEPKASDIKDNAEQYLKTFS